MNRTRTAVVAALVAASVGLPTAVLADGPHDRGRRESRWDRQEDRREIRDDRRDLQRDRRELRRDRRDLREDRRELREDYRDARRNGYWDAARYYRRDARYRPYRLGRNDRIYRGSDARYYCRRDDGTTGLIIGGVAGGVLGNIIAPGGSKTIGAIIGAGAGATIGRAVDRGDIVCE